MPGLQAVLFALAGSFKVDLYCRSHLLWACRFSVVPASEAGYCWLVGGAWRACTHSDVISPYSWGAELTQ